MEIGILRFDGSHAAENALKEVMDAQGDRNPWLREVGVVSRPLIGRLRITAAFPDGGSKSYRQGDLADDAAALGTYTAYWVSSLAGPLASMFATVEATMAASEGGAQLEERLFHLEELKQKLPRDSSALVLLADPDTIDTMVALFSPYEPKVIRRKAEEELRERLGALVRRIAGRGQEQPAPATT